MQHWKQTGLNPTARRERGVVSFVASMLHHQNDTTPKIFYIHRVCITQKMMQHLIQHLKMYIYSIFLILNPLNFHLLHTLSVHHNLFRIEFFPLLLPSYTDQLSNCLKMFEIFLISIDPSTISPYPYQNIQQTLQAQQTFYFFST